MTKSATLTASTLGSVVGPHQRCGPTTARRRRVDGYATVLRHVEDELVSGRPAVGGQLPAERRLAGELGISQPTVREGIRVLQAPGVVRSGVGSGPDAATRPARRPASRARPRWTAPPRCWTGWTTPVWTPPRSTSSTRTSTWRSPRRRATRSTRR
ncbi:GntR family transcriptional regulator [Actinosynnema sp. NPDC023587]|uniref:FadR/GntR family transcriptional regulator n=1 Tax=Actinosynnema sp. NPDC023587 TaxID=3154695 RepID=UPI00340997B3